VVEPVFVMVVPASMAKVVAVPRPTWACAADAVPARAAVTTATAPIVPMILMTFYVHPETGSGVSGD
jgi:hypothetical protein